MGFPILGKIGLVLLTLGVIGGITTVIVLSVNSEPAPTTPAPTTESTPADTTTTSSTTPPAVTPEPPPDDDEPPPDGDEPPPDDDEPPPDGDESPPDGDEPPPDDDEPPPDRDEPPPDGDEPPPDGDEPPPDGDEPPPDGDEPPPDGDEPPPDGDEPPPDDNEPPPDDDEPPPEGFQVGVGIADMTGPAVGIRFMGYASLSQKGAGIHMRQFSRAFIFDKDGSRFVYVSAEILAVGISLKNEVLRRLQQSPFGYMYSYHNVFIVGTHTHSTPGGHLVDFLLDASILGHSDETFQAYVEGITKSIIRAHNSMVPANLFYGRTRVPNVSVNRSPYSYNANPESERERYESNVDDIMTQVRVEKRDGTLLGVLNWYSIHATSINRTNQLISSDNLGYAAYKMEKELNGGTFAGKGSIIAAFFPSSLGDASPNTEGPRCEFSGEPCDNQFSTCGPLETCFARGPGKDMYDSVKIIGTRLYEGAMQILTSPGEKLEGKLKYVHQFADMAQEEVEKYDPITRTFKNDDKVTGCSAALGYSFAAGTTDGANILNITQGTIQGNPLLDSVLGIVVGPTDEDRACHMPKPILLATGKASIPLPWHPRIVSTTLIWLGDLVILGVPGEPTTMAGRRMVDVVGSIMEENGFEPRVVVSGITNEYIHYITTYEEYQVQRYEAASTIYGPHTLDIFLNKFRNFTIGLLQDQYIGWGEPAPGDYRFAAVSLIAPSRQDTHQLGREYGTVIRQPAAEVGRGQTASVTFMSGNPRNNLMQDSSFFMIERQNGSTWVPVANDADFETKFKFERISILLRTSRIQIEWEIPEDATPGVHRVVYYGTSRGILSGDTEFVGTSNNFTVV